MSTRVWIDQDLCTGDGLCTDHCPEVFVLLEDGISYVIDPVLGVQNDPGGSDGLAEVSDRLVAAVVAAADDCPGECIFLEVD
jgi:ferredoxin